MTTYHYNCSLHKHGWNLDSIDDNIKCPITEHEINRKNNKISTPKKH